MTDLFGSKKIAMLVFGVVAIFAALLLKFMIPAIPDDLITKGIEVIGLMTGGGVLGQAAADAASKGLTSTNFQRDTSTTFKDVALAAGLGTLKNLPGLLKTA